tara:strand:- start:1613 stop:2896 length:1284 start_codon:yes stop_codon:yes gene_type:complete
VRRFAILVLAATLALTVTGGALWADSASEQRLKDSLGKDGTAVGGIHYGQRAAVYDGTNTQFQAGDTSGRAIAVGAVANDGVVAGAPVLVGAEAETAGSLSTVGAAGDVTQLKASTSGVLWCSPTTPAGTSSTVGDVDDPVPSAATLAGIEAESVGSVSTVNAEGDLTTPKGTLSGVMYTIPTTTDGAAVAVSATAAGVPGAAMLCGGTDDTNIQPLAVADADPNGASTDFVQRVALVVADDGGADLVGDGADGVPLPTDTESLGGGNAITLGAGAVAGGTQRVTLASDDPAVAALETLDDAISGAEMQVDVVTAPLTEVQGDQVSPTTTSVACDDTGIVSHTFNAATVRAELWNSSTANDICVLWGTAGAPDRSTRSTCALILGSDAGAGATDIYATPADFRVGGEVFECDSAAAATLVITEWRTE